MSIVSSIIAEMNNNLKAKWVAELEVAYENRDWEQIEEFLNKLKNFYFSE